MDNPRKYADEDCVNCGGDGEFMEYDNVITCECTRRNKAYREGEDAFELARGN